MLLLDSGNLLFKRLNIDKGVNQERLTAESIINIYQDLSYDAVGVGPLDLSGGLEVLSHSFDNNFPWVSANLFDGDGKVLFNRWVSKKVQGVDIVITAITAGSAPAQSGITIKPWNTILPALLQDIDTTKDNPFIILLSSLTDKENHRITEQYQNIHLIIGSDRKKANVTPRLINSTLTTQTGTQGKYQGLLNIQFGSQRQWGEDYAKQLADFQNRLGSLNWQLKRLEKKAALPESGNKYQSSLTRLRNEKEELSSKITSTQNILDKENTGGANKDHFTSQFIGLKKNMPSDPATEKKLTQLKQDIRELHQKKKAAAQKRTAGGMAEPGHNLLGNDGCATCHTPQADFWKSTRHAKAYTTLVQKEKNLDLQCLPCHMTQDIQNATLEQLPLERLLNFPEELQAVGCESCHGAGKQHSMEPKRFKTVRLPSEKVCLTCHTDEHDDNFDYSTKLARISCPAE